MVLLLETGARRGWDRSLDLVERLERETGKTVSMLYTIASG
jgi:hypothetical protein